MGGRGFFFCFPVGLFRGSERQLGTGNEGGSRLEAPALFSGLKYYNLRGLPAPLCFSFHERALISPLVGRRRHGELYAEAGGLVGFYFCGQKPGSPVSTLDYITTLDAGGGFTLITVTLTAFRFRFRWARVCACATFSVVWCFDGF